MAVDIEPSLKKGVSLYILSCFFFACCFALIKHAEAYVSIPSIVFYRILSGSSLSFLGWSPMAKRA